MSNIETEMSTIEPTVQPTVSVKLRDLLPWRELSHPTVRDMIKGELRDQCDMLQDAFDRRLQRQYGKLNICGLEVNAPEALYAVSESAYKDRLRFYIDSALASGEYCNIDGMILSCQEALEWFDIHNDTLSNIRAEIYRQEDVEVE